MARERVAFVAALFALAVASHSAFAAERGHDMRLVGTVVSSDSARSLAVIELAGAPRTVRTGGRLDGAELIEIRSDSVLLRRAGEIETLDLASVSVSPAGQGGSVFPASPDGAANGADESAAAHSRAARPNRPAVRARRPAARRPARPPARAAEARTEGEVARSNDELLADLAAQARFAPVMDNDGKLRGVAVMNIVSDSALERLGLQSDDVVVAINGKKIDSSGQAMNEARALPRNRPVKLDVERRGTAIVVNVDLKSLHGK